MKKNALIVLLVFTLVQIAPAFANDLEKTLKDQYEKQVLGLRNPIQQPHQELDSTGKPLVPDSVGRWAVYGGIQIQKISLGPDRLRVEGPWVAIGAKNSIGKPDIIRLGMDIKVELHLDHPAVSADDVRAVMDRVFFLDDANFEHAIPDFRRSDFIVRNEPIPTVDNKTKDKEHKVTAPVPMRTPEPEFSESARRQGFQGAVVLEVVLDKSGTVSRIRILRGLGMGLDQQAVEAVKTWLFQPATRDGSPVAVQMKIEVSFNLYPPVRR